MADGFMYIPNDDTQAYSSVYYKYWLKRWTLKLTNKQ